MSSNVGFKMCDADNHYYETIDACTRHLEKRLKHRGVQFLDRGNHKICLIGEKVSHFIPNPTFEPIAVPGCGDEYFRGQTIIHKPIEQIMELEPHCQAAYREPNARIEVMNQQGIEKAFLFPTFAYGLEEALAKDTEAAGATIRAFNRWLHDDWKFNYDGRLYAAPIVNMSDVESATVEVEWLLEHGACIVTMRPAPVSCADGRKSLGSKRFDPIWARLAEARVPVAFHIADSGYQRYAADWGDHPEFRPISRGNMTMGKLIYQERPIFDTIAALVVHGVFDRHPRLRVASVENGALWIPLLAKKLTKSFNQKGEDGFSEPPIDTLRKHLWVSPYAEDDFPELVKILGENNILMGSDWPHAECLADPASYVNLLEGLPRNLIRYIMRDNFLAFAPLTAN